MVTARSVRTNSGTLVIGGLTTALGSISVVFLGFLLAQLCFFILDPNCVNKEYVASTATTTTKISRLQPTAVSSVGSSNVLVSELDATSKPEVVLGARIAISNGSSRAQTKPPETQSDPSSFPETAKFPPHCTSDQFSVLAKQLPPEGCVLLQKIPWNNGGCSFSVKTLCGNANPHWLHDFFHESNGDDETFRGIIVGCNKGYEAVELLRIVSPPSANEKYDWRKWRERFLSNLTDDVNQMVQCPIRGSATSNANATEKKKVRVYCIDGMPRTVNRLNETKIALNYGDELDITEMVAGANDVIGGVPVLASDRIGAMDVGPYHWERKCSKGSKDCRSVPQVTIDHFIESKQDLRATAKDMKTDLNTSPLIHYMSITAEGYDYHILQGTAKNLGRIQYIDFGYHWNWHWGQKDLKDLIFRLKKKGFVCYFTSSDEEDMWRITDCWQDHYALKFSASIGCANANIPSAEPLLRRMEGMFLKTLEKTL